MARIEFAEEKWFRKASAGAPKWVKNVATPEALEAYVRGVADFLGVSPETIRASLPAKNYASFQSIASQLAEAFSRGIRRAYELRKWSKGYRRAFLPGQ